MRDLAYRYAPALRLLHDNSDHGDVHACEVLEIIADNLSKAGWSWGCVSAIDSDGRTIWIADSHRDDGKRFVVHADEKLTAFWNWKRRFGLPPWGRTYE
jgi:hypothetical protein